MKVKLSKKRVMVIKEKNIEAVIPSKVVAHGNGARIKFYKEFEGMDVYVVVLSKGSNLNANL